MRLVHPLAVSLRCIFLLLLCLATCGCYSMQVRPKITIRLVDTAGWAVPVREGDFQGWTLVHPDIGPLRFTFESDGRAELPQRVDQGSILRMLGAACLSLMPHNGGIREPGARILFNVPPGYQLDPAASGLFELENSITESGGTWIDHHADIVGLEKKSSEMDAGETIMLDLCNPSHRGPTDYRFVFRRGSSTQPISAGLKGELPFCPGRDVGPGGVMH